MSYFDQENWMSQQSVEENQGQVQGQSGVQGQSDVQGRVQEQKQKKTSHYLPQILLLFFVILILTSVIYIFGRSVKGILPTEEATEEVTEEVTEELPAASDGDVLLSAIIYSEDNPMAIVDGEIVHEGDLVDDVKVVKIREGSVDFETSDKIWSQDLPAAKEGVHSGISSLPVLLVLGSDGCPACRKMKPILNKLRSEYSKKFVIKHIDPWADRAAGERYGVRAIPTLIFYDSKGREVFRHVGFYPEAEILTAWRNIGVKL